MPRLRVRWILWAGLATMLMIIAYAWIDGGRMPLGEISEPVAVPGSAQ